MSEFYSIETERLQLRSMADSDIENVHRALSHPEVIKYYAVSYMTLEATEVQMKWFRDNKANGTGHWWALELKDSKDFVGGIGITSVNREHQRGEFGYWLLPEYWKKGHMKEALRAVVDFAFNQWGLHRLMDEVETENQGSSATLESLGFQKEGVLREAEKGEKHRISLDVYAIIKDKK